MTPAAAVQRLTPSRAARHRARLLCTRALLQRPASPERTSDAAKLAALSAACYTLLALDVTSSAPVLGVLDANTHAWVQQNVPQGLRAGLFQQGLSNVPLGLSLLASLGTSATLLAGAETRRSAATALLAATVAFGSPLPLGDWGVLGAAKAAVGRERPTTLSRSLSFPSGHTSITAYHSLVFAAVLHPRRRAAEGAVSQPLLPAACAAIAVVAASRVLADVHWVTDVLAGAAFGAGLAMAVAAVDGLTARDGK